MIRGDARQWRGVDAGFRHVQGVMGKGPVQPAYGQPGRETGAERHFTPVPRQRRQRRPFAIR